MPLVREEEPEEECGQSRYDQVMSCQLCKAWLLIYCGSLHINKKLFFPAKQEKDGSFFFFFFFFKSKTPRLFSVKYNTPHCLATELQLCSWHAVYQIACFKTSLF